MIEDREVCGRVVRCVAARRRVARRRRGGGTFDVERALQDAARMVWRQRMRKGRSLRVAPATVLPCPWPQAETFAPHRPYWLDIVSDLLTNLAIARQAGGPEGPTIAKLLEQTVERLLALLPDRALFDAVQDTSLGEEATELVQLAAELVRRGL